MAMLIFVQQRRSIFRCVLFAVFLELTIVSKCASSQKICIPGSRRDVSYVNVYNDQVDWNTARQKCIARNSILPVICNKDEQDALVAHLKGSIEKSAAWTSGKMIFTNWTWIDGKPFTGFISLEHESYTHVAFDKSRNNYKTQDPRFVIYYLCQYSGSLCNSENAINVTKGCVIPSINDTTWFNASRQCMENGSHLAVLTDADLDTLKRSNKLQSQLSYWIGLQKNTTRHWMWLTTAKHSEYITYTNWSGVLNRREDECLSIDASNGEWKAVGCTEDKKMVVCERKRKDISSTSQTRTRTELMHTDPRKAGYATEVSDATSTLYSSKPTTKTRVMSSVTTAGAMSSTSEISTESQMNSIPNGDSHFLLYSGACAGIVVIVICIIVVILAVRHTRNSPKMMDQSKGEIDSDHNERKESSNKQTTSLIHTPANASANAPVAGTDDALGVYAEIAPAPLNQSEDEAEIHQPGIVYAALEFQKEPTYLEPGQKSAHASNQTKVGPMGGIYAIPDAKGRTGNEATPHPLLVTSKGDVYALPLKNSKSPTANSPIGGIYANL